MKRIMATIGCILSIFGAIGLQGALSNVAAHPHVWVTVKTEIAYDENNAISGFRHKWTFDEYYSSFAVQGLDQNGDSKYDQQELAELAEVNITSLKEFGYFTFPRLAGKVLERGEPKDYRLEYDGTQLTLFLTLPLAKGVKADEVKGLTFAVYDPTFYVDFSLAKESPISLAGAPAGCQPVITDPDPSATEVSVTGLGEAFFNNLDANSTEAEIYAKKISISCPAS